MIGPGKYDDAAEAVLAVTRATGLLLVVVDGTRGSGVSCKLTRETIESMPKILRQIADELERDGARLTGAS